MWISGNEMDGNKLPGLPLAVGASFNDRPTNAAGFEVPATLNPLSHDEEISCLGRGSGARDGGRFEDGVDDLLIENQLWNLSS